MLFAPVLVTGHLYVSTLTGNQALFLLLLSLLAGTGTLLGAALALLIPFDCMLPFLAGFAGGVMSSVAACELLPTSVALGGSGAALAGCLTGGAFLFSATPFYPITQEPKTNTGASAGSYLPLSPSMTSQKESPSALAAQPQRNSASCWPSRSG
ncbi:hypothetical protein, partial [Thermodesulfitimonas sp.]